MTALFLVIAVLLLAANAFMVAAEVALTAAATRRSTLEALAARGQLRARWASACVQELSFSLTGAQLGITMASLGLGFVAEPAIAEVLEAAVAPLIEVPAALIHTVAAVVALSIVVFLHMVFAEMAPKNLAIADPIRTALWVAVPFRLYANTIRGPLRLLNALANLVVRMLGVRPQDELLTSYSADQVRSMLTALRRVGAIAEPDQRLARSALRFGTRKVQDVMVPRSAMVAVPLSATPRHIEERVVATGYSRFPVHGDNPDDVRGFVHAKDLLSVGPAAVDRPLPGHLIRRMPVALESGELGHLLVEMQRQRSHMALVIDEHGTATGIVTLTDLVEELVGDIPDELVAACSQVRRTGPDSFVLAGSLRLDELQEATGCRLPGGDYSTVGGFIMARLDAVPKVGQTVSWGDWRLRVRSMDGRRVEEIELRHRAPSATPPVPTAG